jgi:uncharacterized protein with gpF-like domain
MQFKEAIAALAAKANLDTDSWRDTLDIDTDAFFTVAKAKGDLLQEIRQAVDQSIVRGETIDQFRGRFVRIMARWSPKWAEGSGHLAWRSRLIIQQNMRRAYTVGRYQQMTDPVVLKNRPYWQFRHGGANEPRPHHIALDRKVYRAEDVKIWPPFGFGCSCQFYSLSQADVDRLGLKVEPYFALEADAGFGAMPGADRSHEILNLSPDLQLWIRSDVERRK